MRIFILCALWISCPWLEGAPRERLVLSYPENQPFRSFVEMVYEVLRDTVDGYCFELQPYPSARALQMARSGKTDGEALRVDPQWGKQRGDLLVLPSALVSVQILLILKRDANDVTSSDQAKKLKTVAMLGTFIDEAVLKRPASMKVSGLKQGFRMVATGRDEGMLVLEFSYFHFLAQFPEHSDRFKIASFKQEVPMHLMLGTKYRSILPELSRIIADEVPQGAMQNAADRFVSAYKLAAQAAVARFRMDP